MIERILPFTRNLATVIMNSPFRRVAGAFGFKQKVTEGAYIDLVNKKNEAAFKKVPIKKRALFLPHCTRNKNCPAKLGKYGYECKECGKCGIAKVKKAAEKMGYSVYIVPGGSVVWKIIKDKKPEAVVGVACTKELVMALEITENGKIPAQTSTLLRDGCVNTLMDEDDIIEVLSK